jgi:hypothetical protein
VKKDKLFFFVSYQETQQKNGISPAGYSDPTLVGIPQGDRNTPAFQAALGAAFCPGGSATAGTVQGHQTSNVAQVACNGSNINPVALNLLELKNPNGSYYIPSSSTGVNQNTTFSIPATYRNTRPLATSITCSTSKNTLSGRWFYSGDRRTHHGVRRRDDNHQCLPGGPGAIYSPPSTPWEAHLDPLQ